MGGCESKGGAQGARKVPKKKAQAPPKKKLNPADAKLNGDMIGTGAGLLSSPRALAYDPGLHLFQED
eukprot:g20665.t1